MRLIKVSVALAKVDAPLDPRWRKPFGAAVAIAGIVASMIAGYHGMALVSALMMSVLSPLGICCMLGHRWSLPASARRFLKATRAKRDDLVRRTEAYNRAWCLAERGREHMSSPGGPDPFLAGHEKLRAEVDAYAASYAAAVADELRRVGIDPDRKAVRQDLIERGRDLAELEAQIEALGKDADAGMRARAREIAEKLEKDCIKAKQPIGLVRARRPRPQALPIARAITHDRP